MKDFILSLDQGTTSSRAILYDAGGEVVSTGRQPLRNTYPQQGWVEQDPEEIWQSQFTAAREAIEQAGITADSIAAIGIANQRETTILWDSASGEPLCPAIVWQCRRSASICEELRRQGWEPSFKKRTGLQLDAYFSGPKIRWALDHIPAVQQAAKAGRLKFGTVDSWLIWKLTGGGVHATDVSNASRTLLLNLQDASWDEECLHRLDLSPDILPRVCSSSGVIGETESGIFGRALPIAGIAGDQQAALFGQLAFAPGDAKCTFGTGCFILVNLGDALPDAPRDLLATIAWQKEGRLTYAVEGSVFMGGAVLEWLRDKMEVLPDVKASSDIAASVKDTEGLYLVPAFVGLGAPHWDMYARGILMGITQATTRSHLIRAGLESIAYQVCDIVELLPQQGGLEAKRIRVDGGACRNDFLMQFLADILGIPVERPANIETTSLGAAFLAGLAVGLWKDESELEGLSEIDHTFEPSLSLEQRQQLIADWRRAVDRSRAWVIPE